jgi:hypothetical protein
MCGWDERIDRRGLLGDGQTAWLRHEDPRWRFISDEDETHEPVLPALQREGVRTGLTWLGRHRTDRGGEVRRVHDLRFRLVEGDEVVERAASSMRVIPTSV